MNKIKTKADAINLIKHLVETGGSLVLWELTQTCIVITSITENKGFGTYNLDLHEDVAAAVEILGYSDKETHMTDADLVELIWNNRKTINEHPYNIDTVFC